MPLLSPRGRRVLGFILPYWPRALFFLFVMLVSNAIGMAFPFVMKVAIDQAIGQANRPLLLTLIGAVFGILLVEYALSAAGSYVYTGFTSKILFDMRFDLFRKLQRLPVAFFLRTKVGDVASRVTSDIAEVQTFATQSLFSLTDSTLRLTVATAALLFLNWKLFLMTAAFVPLSALAIRPFRSKLKEVSRRIREQNAEISQFIFENITGMKVVKGSGAQSFEGKRFVSINREWIRRLLGSQKLSALLGGINGILIGGTMALVYGIGGSQVISGTWTLGSLIAFSTYLLMLIGPVHSLMNLYIDLQKARASMDRVFEYLDKPEEPADGASVIRPAMLRGEIELVDVTFGYDSAEPILEGVSFRVPSRGSLAIVGRTGAGKSSLLELLLRFYEPRSGRILLDGRDLREYHRRALMRRIAIVPQDPLLFHATVLENLRYGSRRATRDEVEAACRAACIHEFVASLPDEYATVVGERGMRLSGGERQRLAIARALLRRPDVMLFDEATSALDSSVEREILDQLQSLAWRATTIFVTHRLSIAASVDQVIVLDDHRIVERGSHEELLASRGFYYGLHRERELAAESQQASE